jgi:hypothetical protein
MAKQDSPLTASSKRFGGSPTGVMSRTFLAMRRKRSCLDEDSGFICRVFPALVFGSSETSSMSAVSFPTIVVSMVMHIEWSSSAMSRAR